ncbi:MAG: hypothetical protein LBC03_04160, partial [Nitrososphaerota archaeon]|nr:hypothetical protein [Nitrososphaerota archaeon]
MTRNLNQNQIWYILSYINNFSKKLLAEQQNTLLYKNLKREGHSITAALLEEHLQKTVIKTITK